MADLDNLEAWAIGEGYDPTFDYTASKPEPRPEGMLSAHFNEDEFRCHHCGELAEGGVPQALVDVLEDVRSHFGGKPITINSGYRCPAHNAEVGGASDSQHMHGTAADIVVKGVPPNQVYAYLDPIHNGGLGSYNSFTHVDVRGSKARWNG